MTYKTLTSPTRGTNYTALDAVKKFLERRNFEVQSIKVGEVYPPQYFGYSDHDGYMIMEVRSLESEWTESIQSVIYAEVPFHITGAGAYEFGDYASMPENGTEPEYYSGPRKIEITSWVGDGEEETLSLEWDMSATGNVDRLQKEIVNIFEKAFIMSAMNVLTENTESEEI